MPFICLMLYVSVNPAYILGDNCFTITTEQYRQVGLRHFNIVGLTLKY